MDKNVAAFNCTIIRGGTSKGLFLNENELPPEGDLRDKVILRLLGSPDQRQIDGLGGANSLTSKICVIGPSEHADADVDYTFGQVSVDKPKIDWLGNCGNLTSAVGLYAVNKNYVKAKEPETIVRIFNTNTSKIIHVKVPVDSGYAISSGDFSIPGVPGTSSRLTVDFYDPAGGVTGRLLPTGNPKDIVDLGPKGKFVISIIDAVTPVVYLKAEDLGLKGTELPTEVENMPEVLSLMEEIRSETAVMLGIVDDKNDATRLSPGFPKIGFVSKSQDYKNPEGIIIKSSDVDFVARLASMQKMHRAYMIGAAVSSGAASKVPGTLIWDRISEKARESDTLIIGQPYGPMEVRIDNQNMKINKVSVERTARVLMDGIAYIPKKTFK